MERIAYKIALDVTKAESQKFLTGFSIGENRARVLKITLNNGRNPIHFDGTETISMFVTKPSDSSPSIGLCYLEDDTIIYNVLQSDVSEEGAVKFSLKVEQLEEDLITVLYAAHFTIQVTDPECDDSHVPEDPNFSILEQLIAEVEEFDSDAEAYAVGTRGGEPVEEGDPAYHNNAKYYAENLEVEVEEQVERAEAWATGTRGGEPVEEGDPQYHNNAKYHAEQAYTSADNAATSESNAATSETNASGYASAAATSAANALSYKNAASGSATDASNSALAAATSESNALSYKNAASGSATNASNSASAAATSESNALSYKNAASQSATDASGSATSASGSALSASGSANTASQKALDSEAWAEGTRGGVPVGPSDPTYEKNAKYWAEQASAGQIQADWNQADNTKKDYIKNKPTIPDAQIQSDWNQADNTKKDFIKNKPTIPSTAADISLVTTGTSLPGTVDDLQKLAEYMFPPGVNVTLTLNGAKNDVITVKDSNDQTVGTCTFATGQTSGTVQISVPVGGGNFKFVSAVAKGITEETKNDDYEKTVALSDVLSQTVNVYPKNALYWYGNKVNVTAFWGNNSDNIQRNTTPPDGSITENTNNIICTGGVRRRGICSSTPVTGTTLKGFVTTSNVVGDGTVKLSENANDTTLTTRVDIASINTPQTDYIVSGSITSGNYALLSQYNVDLTIKALWSDDGHEDDITIHGAKEDTITIKDSDNQTVATCIFGSGQTVGYVSKALLPPGTYKFISSVAKGITEETKNDDYEKTITLDGSESEVNVYPDGLMIYWYGNVVNGGAWSQGRTSGYFGFDNATNYMRVYKNSATLGGVGETIATANTIDFSGYSKLKATGKAYRTTPPSGYNILEYAFVGFYSSRDLGPGDAGSSANSISFSSIPANTVETREVSITTPTSGYCYSTDNFPEAGIYLYALWAEI